MSVSRTSYNNNNMDPAVTKTVLSTEASEVEPKVKRVANPLLSMSRSPRVENFADFVNTSSPLRATRKAETTPRSKEEATGPRVIRLESTLLSMPRSQRVENFADWQNALPLTSLRQTETRVPESAEPAFSPSITPGVENSEDFMNISPPPTSPRGDEELPIFEGAAPSGFTGEATVNYEDGGVYSGDFEDGLRCGIGTLTYPNRVYIADWKNDKLHGVVKLTFEAGGSYIGHWENGKRLNRGMLIYQDGSYYAGDLKNGKYHGYGIRTHIDRSFYLGMWQNDKREGHGFSVLPDGSVFNGTWANNLPHGKITLFDRDGKIK